MRRNILLVDDEKPILRALNRSLRKSGLGIFQAEDGPAALDILGREDIDVIISDLKMPGMSGIQLLTKVKRLYPDTIRIILSGNDDEEIFQASGQGLFHRYIMKPWDSELLINTINQLLEVRAV